MGACVEWAPQVTQVQLALMPAEKQLLDLVNAIISQVTHQSQ